MKINYKSIQSQIGYEFKNDFQSERLFTEALTHKSYSVDENKNQSHNERLEFLGDSILNFVIATDLIKKYPNESEGSLSKKRASLVNQTTLAVLAQKLMLSELIFFGPGEIKQGSPLNPRILASAVEALIGAIFLDSEIITCEKWVLNLFTHINFEQIDKISNASDFKTRLQELTQQKKIGTPIYEVLLTTGPSHKPQFLVSLKLNGIEKARAEGSSKKSAEQVAAEMYLNELLSEIKSELLNEVKHVDQCEKQKSNICLGQNKEK